MRHTGFQRYVPFRAFRGERGVVFLCSDVDSRVPVALKTIDPQLCDDVRTLESVLAAARRWVAVGAHPHVVRAHRVCEDPEEPYVVLDFVEPAAGMPQPSLRCWMQSPLAPSTACAIALGMARGMYFATERVDGLAHGDLRPENVLIGRDLRARVTDFGLGVAHPQHVRYWAPERWSGAAGAGADLYSFGLVVLEMLLGPTAVPTGSASDIRHAHSAGAPRDACHALDDTAIRDLIRACLEPSPSRRPKGWGEVTDKLVGVFPRLAGRDAPSIPDATTAAREDTVMHAWSSLAIAHAMRDRGEHGEALVAYRGVARTARREGDVLLEAVAVEQSARMLRMLGRDDAAVRELLCALELRQMLRDSVGQADVLLVLGDIYAREGDTENALASMFAAARLFAESGDRRSVALCRRRMAPVLAAVGRNTEARDAEAECAAILADLDQPA